MKRLKTILSLLVRNGKTLGGVAALSLISGGAVGEWGWGIGAVVLGGVIWLDLTVESIQNGRSS